MNARRVVCGALLIAVALPAVAASPPTLSYFCQASVKDARTFYVTGIFTVTAETKDVTNAWRKHIGGTDSKARKTALCQAGLDVASLEDLKKLTTDSSAAEQLSVIDVEWTYAPDPR
jgi:hypothetical protein